MGLDSQNTRVGLPQDNAYGHFGSKRQKWKEGKSDWSPANLKSRQANWKRVQVPSKILYGFQLHPLGLHLCFQATFLWVKGSLFPACRVWGSDSLPSPHPLCPFRPKLAVLLLVADSQEPVGLPTIYVQRLTPLDKRLLQRSCLDNPPSIFGFCLEAEGLYESHP